MLQRGKTRSPRGLKTLELEDAVITISSPTGPNSLVTLPERGLSMDYLRGELKWYLSGSLEVEGIAKYSKFWRALANADGTVNSNYGHYVLGGMFTEFNNNRCKGNQSQFDWCYQRLKEDPSTRKAIINFNQPYHKYEENKDFVCTVSQIFRMDDAGRLVSKVYMRSNDLIYGFCYDVPFFTLIQRMMAYKLGIPFGRYQHHAESLHVYEKHFGILVSTASH
jgi:thymidylate synthase